SHSYPHCWRCKRPVIFRLTAQWFISMEKGDLRRRALQAIDGVEWIPPWGKNRIGGMVEQRPDWCVSRQRLWGVPIVAVVCESCGTSHTTADLVERAAVHFEKCGTDTWYTEPVETFVSKDFACPQCGTGTRFRKEQDILDVWFDSGVSYAAVLEREMGKGTIADLYLEGSDQHRGWFHTSLLTSIGTRQRAPYKRVLTHGFVVDGEGRKYSKSAKNYVPPEKLIEQHGVEILRLWVAAEDYRDDIRFSDVILTRLVESYRKIRNTCRYLLGNLSDFDPQRDAVPYEQMEEIDRWAMHVLHKLIERVRHGYETFEFHTIYHTLNRFTTVELSAFYLDILKDRLYTERKDGRLRRSAQTVLWNVADTLTRLMAPILSFTAHEVWGYLPKRKDAPDSIFLTDLPSANAKMMDETLGERWERLVTVRSSVTKVLEEARAAKTIGNPLEAKITIFAPKELTDFLKSFGTTLPDLFIGSGVEFGGEASELKVSVQPADGKKCARCWKYATTVGTSTKHPEICARCVSVVEGRT
ncbi:MAG: class I tRNA ligase family protein, partial [Deltaproteobacteria bacterium]|nr:class I tRNA ligase family protein [Deltaproteobacteria bacterium]